ncbi:LacI family DNA-binding transcriptional regulator [Caenimonas aquaedulcis]|uniref:LacI family DNA-binding transcriptional regulator n=1 Tax=Caenimonas aquaedulcis TaxID=2793270 RepID=A0A931H894_9BURK|nr:LacI family DNA-binding transcriptional regulator [Caenimonas aquaedulcis]MBG9390539.1 LacI family DNA-binding transcriptional regulator [Caenimonas aquaedulcis]
MRKNKSTIYDLARLADVSATTVSSVLSGNWRSRRIAEETAQRVLALAAEHRFSVNRQASGLRTSRSGLIGMIIPLHDNRYFSGMAQTFEKLARQRHLYPIVVSTLRDPALELETVRTLISYRVESLVVAGATDPDAISDLCKSHDIAHVNVDLPGRKSTSVITDNFWGAQQLTAELIARSRALRAAARNRPYFLGGIATDYATARRIEGFTDAVRTALGDIQPGQVDACGYEPDLAEAAAASLYKRIGGLPRALFVNSTIALEGVVRFLKRLPHEELERCAFGCYDWDPFGSMLSFPLLMVRQNVDGLLEQAFAVLDAQGEGKSRLIEIRPVLVFS